MFQAPKLLKCLCDKGERFGPKRNCYSQSLDNRCLLNVSSYAPRTKFCLLETAKTQKHVLFGNETKDRNLPVVQWNKFIQKERRKGCAERSILPTARMVWLRKEKTILLDQKHLGSFEMYHWRKTEKMSWNDYVRNEEVLQTDEERNILQTIKTRKVTSCKGTAFWNTLLNQR